MRSAHNQESQRNCLTKCHRDGLAFKYLFECCIVWTTAQPLHSSPYTLSQSLDIPPDSFALCVFKWCCSNTRSLNAVSHSVDERRKRLSDVVLDLWAIWKLPQLSHCFCLHKQRLYLEITACRVTQWAQCRAARRWRNDEVSNLAPQWDWMYIPDFAKNNDRVVSGPYLEQRLNKRRFCLHTDYSPNNILWRGQRLNALECTRAQT